MTFFYDLNKKLDSIREKPEVTHGQLNERDMSRAAKGYEKYGKQGMEALAKAGREGKALDPVRKKYDKYDEGIEDRLKDLDPKNPVNIPAYQRKAAEQGRPVKETGGAPMTAKQKSFAKLAPPVDKITFADKIAGAKKEVDEMLGDVAAEAMKNALSGGQKKLDKNDNGRLDANDFEMLRKGASKLGSKAPQAKVSQHSTLKPHSNPKSGLSGQVPSNKEETDEGWDDMLKDVERRAGQMKPGEKVQGHKGEIERTATGIRHTRRYDDKTGETDVGDDEQGQDAKRGRGRPKGTKSAIGAKGPSGRSKLMNKEASHDENPNIAKAKAILKKAGYTVTMDGEEDLEEKAVSKKQQRFMGMVHATQKGEKAPSKEVGKVAKSMGKKDAEDFASTKHKGLPEKKKPEAKKDDAPKKKEKTEEQGGTGTPTASSGFSYGKGIYDSMNHELESMIAEGMNVNMSMNTDANGGPSKSLTVTATDDDALKLGKLLKMAGLGDGGESGYGGSGYQSACGCGTPDCSCGDQEMDEAYGDNAVSQNEPDYPTNTETSADALQYSGGLNKPKSTGQSTVPVLASQEERQESYAEAEEDALHRMMEMAGQPASGMGAQVGDMIDYVNPNGEEPSEELVIQSGVQYDPDTKVISVPNSTQLADLHRKIEAAGWKKQTAAARPNPMASRQAQVAGDVPYQLGEEDELSRIREMAGIKEAKKPDANKDGIPDYAQDGKGAKDLGKAKDKEKKVDEGILASTANLWKQYKGNHGV